MQLLAWAPHAAPLPRRSKVEAFWNSFNCDRSIAVLQSVPAFLLQTPGGDPAAPAQVARCHMLPESVETGPVAYRPVPFLETDRTCRICTALEKRIGFSTIPLE